LFCFCFSSVAKAAAEEKENVSISRLSLLQKWWQQKCAAN